MRWSEAGQVAAVLRWPASAADGALPEAAFDALRAEGRAVEAAFFLGQALPRYEAVAWAVQTVRELTDPDPASAAGEALKAALLWLQDPTEPRRRTAFEAAQRMDDGSPSRLCALAVFFSGGSLAPENLQPAPPPKDVAGRFAASAVLAAAAGSGRRDAALAQALAAGDRLASGGTAQP